MLTAEPTARQLKQVCIQWLTCGRHGHVDISWGGGGHGAVACLVLFSCIFNSFLVPLAIRSHGTCKRCMTANQSGYHLSLLRDGSMIGGIGKWDGILMVGLAGGGGGVLEFYQTRGEYGAFGRKPSGISFLILDAAPFQCFRLIRSHLLVCVLINELINYVGRCHWFYSR